LGDTNGGFKPHHAKWAGLHTHLTADALFVDHRNPLAGWIFHNSLGRTNLATGVIVTVVAGHREIESIIEKDFYLDTGPHGIKDFLVSHRTGQLAHTAGRAPFGMDN
jgi:hypothetical protein